VVGDVSPQRATPSAHVSKAPSVAGGTVCVSLFVCVCVCQ